MKEAVAADGGSGLESGHLLDVPCRGGAGLEFRFSDLQSYVFVATSRTASAQHACRQSFNPHPWRMC